MKVSRRKWLGMISIVLLVLKNNASEEVDLPETVKERMKKNLPLIEKLKKEGKVGENNRGYLHPIEKLTQEEEALVRQENTDRKLVYTYLAKKLGVPIEEVEKARAKQIRERSAPGIWIQDLNGKWYKKEK